VTDFMVCAAEPCQSEGGLSLHWETWLRHAWVNRLQTALLVLALLGIGAFAGALLFGRDGMWITFGACLVALVIQPATASRLTLRLYRARPITLHEAPGLWRIAHELAARAGLQQVPALHYVPSSVVNAFAVGSRRKAAIALTGGLLRALQAREIAGVLAHEIAHIAHGDLRVMGLADYVSRLTGAFAVLGTVLVVLALPRLVVDPEAVNLTGLLLLAVSPHLALLAQLGLSRVREFDADLKAAALTGDPAGLAAALTKIERANRGWRAWLLPGWGNPEPSWLRTHPASEERIRRLLALKQPERAAPAFETFAPSEWPSASLRPPRWYPGGYWR
jgi:heat shock protein HtpX